MAHGQDDEAPGPDEIHVSPDGALRLLVFYGDDPTIGFDGFAWHVHGDMYPHDGAPRAVIEAWAADILSNRRLIIECWKDGVRRDLWTPEHNDFDFSNFLEDEATWPHGDPEEVWRARTWSG